MTAEWIADEERKRGPFIRLGNTAAAWVAGKTRRCGECGGAWVANHCVNDPRHVVIEDVYPAASPWGEEPAPTVRQPSQAVKTAMQELADAATVLEERYRAVQAAVRGDLEDTEEGLTGSGWLVGELGDQIMGDVSHVSFTHLTHALHWLQGLNRRVGGQ